MEDFESPNVGCRVNSSRGSDLGCQLCWLTKHGDNKSDTREDCIKLNIGELFKPKKEK